MATGVSIVTWASHTNLTFVFLRIIVGYNQFKFLCWFVNISTTQNLESGNPVDAVTERSDPALRCHKSDTRPSGFVRFGASC